jgi:hypothetical protein
MPVPLSEKLMQARSVQAMRPPTEERVQVLQPSNHILQLLGMPEPPPVSPVPPLEPEPGMVPVYGWQCAPW